MRLEKQSTDHVRPTFRGIGITIIPRKYRRLYPNVLIDLDFADDIALLSNNVSQDSECKK